MLGGQPEPSNTVKGEEAIEMQRLQVSKDSSSP